MTGNRISYYIFFLKLISSCHTPPFRIHTLFQFSYYRYKILAFQQQGMDAMIVESDSTVAIDLIIGEPRENSPHSAHQKM